LCLDEPTAGVAQREAEAFGPLIKRVQQELDATLILVEHDLPLILTISDHVYCMEAGGIIAEGVPEAVRSDPVVIASYLGTDERASRGNQADHGRHMRNRGGGGACTVSPGRRDGRVARGRVAAHRGRRRGTAKRSGSP